MKPTRETQAILKVLSVYDDFHHIGQELASTMNEHQERNFHELVVGYQTIKLILGES
jgi:hypothetical protein